MQFSNIFTVLALAMTATALPAADVAARTDSGSCNNNQKAICCNGGLIGGILCSVQILAIGDICSGETFCCSNDVKQGGLLNINLLNCAKLL
ncbi:hypothetical protein N657DRAFT_648762 [Parathielavia appendiculata]|uniref:Hydrophobin n=1 Tax=Parathielavia appendiculata TaxID=2587402 RepID=A0AAN6TTW8_9PEZI|nr:hypothetical protein N657DRAFT_648762 [Parathielavia appendiculata]